MIASQTVSVPVPEDVQAFAREQGSEAYLPVVLEAATRSFPGTTLRLAFEEDHEIADMRYIVVFVGGLEMSNEQFLAATDEFSRDLFNGIPIPLLGAFRLGLE